MGDESKIQIAEEYIVQFAPEVQKNLKDLRAVILEAAPDATEKISWGMLSYSYHGVLAFIGANQKHIGFYPGANGIEAFLPRLAGYKVSKGTVRFPLDEPIPFDIVREIVLFKVDENTKRRESRKKKRPQS